MKLSLTVWGRVSRDKVCKASKTASETRGQTLHRQEQNRTHMIGINTYYLACAKGSVLQCCSFTSVILNNHDICPAALKHNIYTSIPIGNHQLCSFILFSLYTTVYLTEFQLTCNNNNMYQQWLERLSGVRKQACWQSLDSCVFCHLN